MTINQAFLLKGWLLAERAPQEIMSAIDEVIGSLSGIESPIPSKPAPVIELPPKVADKVKPVPPPAVAEERKPAEPAPQKRAVIPNQHRWTDEEKDRLLRMRDVEKKGWPEIAEAMGMSKGQASGYYYLLRSNARKEQAAPGEARAPL